MLLSDVRYLANIAIFAEYRDIRRRDQNLRSLRRCRVPKNMPFCHLFTENVRRYKAAREEMNVQSI